MRRLAPFFIVCLPFIVTGCIKQLPLNAGADKIFAALEKDGPKVDGVQATLLKSARRAEAKGDYQKALQLYGRLLNIEDEKTEYQLGVANNLRRSGNAKAAEAAYDQILNTNPDMLEAKEGKALTNMQEGEFVRAGKILSEVYAQDNTRWRTLNALGVVLIERKKYNDAIAYFKAALKQPEAKKAAIYNNIGLAYAISGDMGKALAMFEKGYRAAPSNTPVEKQLALNKAMILGLDGQLEQAERILTEYLSEAAVANNLGLYSYLSNNEELAKSYLNTAMSRTSRHYNRAWQNLETITATSGGTKDREDNSRRRNRNSKSVKVNTTPSDKEVENRERRTQKDNGETEDDKDIAETKKPKTGNSHKEAHKTEGPAENNENDTVKVESEAQAGEDKATDDQGEAANDKGAATGGGDFGGESELSMDDMDDNEPSEDDGESSKGKETPPEDKNNTFWKTLF